MPLHDRILGHFQASAQTKLDAATALYEWNYPKQILWMKQAEVRLALEEGEPAWCASVGRSWGGLARDDLTHLPQSHPPPALGQRRTTVRPYTCITIGYNTRTRAPITRIDHEPLPILIITCSGVPPYAHNLVPLDALPFLC